eukprot:PhF_6_TR27971/c1_g2_i9/m.41378
MTNKALEYVNVDSFSNKDKFNHIYPTPWSSYYGDGAEVKVSYNAYMCPRLPIPPDIHKCLKENIQRIASHRNDVQGNMVVEDIVDPDLYPRIIPPEERVLMGDQRLGEMTRNTLMNSQCRGSYCWIPTEVDVIGATSVRFRSPIHNLPNTRNNEAMYDTLETVLGGMLPGLWEVLGSSLTSFQVVVKVQRYRVPAGSTYSGQWHTEGVTEDVTAVGVYYAEWPEELTGGELKFRIPEGPDEFDRQIMTHEADGLSVCVPMSERSAIVFSNDIPHRFKRLTNQTDHTLYRAFVNFFVIAPHAPKPSTEVIPTNADIFLALKGILVSDVIALVL